MVSPQIARDFVYISDVLEAFLRIDKLSSISGEIFNIGTGSQSTIKDIVDAVSKAVGKSPPVHWGKMTERPWDTETWVADCTKTKHMIGWSAHTNLHKGISKTVEWHHK